MGIKSNNSDRYTFDETYDLDPQRVTSAFSSANSGHTKKQSRIANELTEKDPAISQAWNVRVASIASCPWEIVGNNSEFIKDSLESITPQYDSGLVSFNKFLNFLQSAPLHGFAVAQTEYINAGTVIAGFKTYTHSLFGFTDSTLPYYIDSNGDKSGSIYYPRWIYHTATNARDQEPLRTGLVRPLAYLYAFRRHVQIEYLRGIEKYAQPMPHVKVSEMFWEDNAKRQQLKDMMNNMTYDGYLINQFDDVSIEFLQGTKEFKPDTFLNYLNYAEKQIFRLILGQDSTSASENSNRSTAQVHDLVRKDLLASDAKSIEETINSQIIKPLHIANFGKLSKPPKFRFNLKGVAELNEIATFMKVMSEAGYEVNEKDLSNKLGMKITKKNSEGTQIHSSNEVSEKDHQERERLKFDSLKSKFDAYGVAVRAGALTPQTSDEDQFRKEAGLPDMSDAVGDAWFDDGGVRRPITLQSKTERDAEIIEESLS